MFKENFKQLLTIYNLNYVDFSNKSGIPRTTISGWMNAQRLPDYNALIKISDFFNITIDELVGREQKPVLEVKQDNDIAQLIKDYKRLSEKQKQHVRIVIGTFLDDTDKLYEEIFKKNAN